MKKIIASIITILLIFSTSFSLAFADTHLEKVSLKEDGRGRNYQVVKLKLGDKLVNSEDVPPIIYPINNQGRTLVPLRMILEYAQDNLNAKIEWDGINQQVKIETDKKNIILKINSSTAIVNNVEKRLPDDVPAKLLTLGYTSRTMVPIRFFAEELDLDIGWEAETFTASINIPKKEIEDSIEDIEKPLDKDPSETEKDMEDMENDIEQPETLTDVRILMKGNSPQIRIKTSSQVKYNQFKLLNPERLVVDLENTKFDLDNKAILEGNGTLNIKPNNDVLKSVRVSQFEQDPCISRIVVDLNKSIDYEISYDKTSGEIVIDFLHYIRDIKKEFKNAKEVIVIEGDSVSDYTIMRLVEPERLVVDIKGGVLHNRIKNSVIDINGKIAKAVRVSQFSPENSGNKYENARIVIDINENVNYDEMYAEIEDDKIIVHLEGKPFETLQYEETGWTTSKLTFKGSTVTRYGIDRQAGSNTIQIAVPKKDMEMEFANLQIDDHIIKSINVVDDKNRDQYKINLELQDSVEYDLLSSLEGQDLVLELNNKDAKYREKLIIIDPGHGGSDPGTTSTTLNIRESEIVLDISKRFNKLLTEAGFRTYMTRIDGLNRNVKLSLQERVDVANALEADLFISIHANAALNSTANGLENYYYNSAQDPLDNRDSKKLAEIFQSEMVEYLNTNSRGAKPANYFVLRHTTMPAILTETGFLSNPGDEAKLTTNEYRQRVAEAMLKSTIRYFEETR